MANYRIMIVGISGKKGSGKDLTVALLKKLLTENGYHPGALYTLRFADPLKDLTCRILGCTREQLEDRAFKVKDVNWEGKPMTPRSIMQVLGTEVGRHVHPNVWVYALENEYKAIMKKHINLDLSPFVSPEPIVFVPDVRFPNELGMVIDYFGVTLRINRKTDSTDNHPSETSLDDSKGFDFIIDNNGTIEDLQQNLLPVVKEILGRTV